MPEFLKDIKRTHDCGGLRVSDVGKRAVLFGWVASRGTMMPGAPEPHEYIGGSIQRVDLSRDGRDRHIELAGSHRKVTALGDRNKDLQILNHHASPFCE